MKTPEELQKAIEESGEFIVFKIMPNPEEEPHTGEQEPQTSGKGKVSNKDALFFLVGLFIRTYVGRGV